MLHTPIFVVGKARERSDVVAAEIAESPDAEVFSITTRTEAAEQDGAKRGVKMSLALAVAIAMVGAGLAVKFLGARLALVPMAGTVVGGVWLVCWTQLVFNSLVRLRSRVRQAWSQVDVHLKRRHDYLPQLLPIISAIVGHEQIVQRTIAELQTQMVATAPGKPGPNFSGLAPSLRVLTEEYPTLWAEKAFKRLRDELVDTEHRIALAREYYNEIATHYATRLQTYPDRILAFVGRMKPEAIMPEARFERAVVSE